MTWGKYITGYAACALFILVVATPFPGLAQRASIHTAQQRHQAPPPPQRGPASQPQVARPQPQVQSSQRGHAGDWLRRYKDLPPDEQEHALQNDPAFRSLPPDRQQMLRQRLQHFSSLSPQEQLRMLNRMETWEHLTPEQKLEARQIFRQMQQLPPDRQRMVRTAVQDLRAMPPDQREKVIDSDRFKGEFSDQEREMMRGVSRLPLAPSEGEGTPQE